jgi:hypothetical protein
MQCPTGVIAILTLIITGYLTTKLKVRWAVIAYVEPYPCGN